MSRTLALLGKELADLRDRRPPGPLRRLGRPGYLRGGPGRGGPVDQEREQGEQEEDPHHVVGSVAGLRADKHLGVQHHRGAEQGGGANRPRLISGESESLSSATIGIA